VPAPCYFEIHADDCARAQTFYGGLFGWRFMPLQSDVEYYRIDTSEPGAMQGGLLKRPIPWQPTQAVNGFVVTLFVTSLDDVIEKAIAAGAVLMMTKFAVKGLGWTAYLIDTEKNVFGLFQQDASAQ
jgi:predicted enzyme related to lactoylglutathione lyase